MTASTFLENSLNTLTEFHECCNEELIKFWVKKCEDCDDFNEMKEAIKDITLKTNKDLKYQNLFFKFMRLFIKG